MSLRVEPTSSGVPLEAIPLALASVDRNLRLVAWSPAFTRFVEPGVVLAPGADLSEVLPDGVADTVARALAAHERADDEPLDVVLGGPSGRRTWSVRVSTSPAGGGGAVVAIEDVTPSRRIAFRARALQEVAVELGGVTDRDHVAASVAHGARALGASRASIGIVSGDGRRVRVEPIARGDDGPAPAWREDPIDVASPLAEVARTGARVVFAHGEEVRARYGGMPGAGEHGALAAVPIHVADRVAGALAVHWPDDGEVSDDTLFYMEALARLAGQALERIDLLDRERRSRLRAEAVARIAARLAAPLSEADVIRLLLRSLSEAVGAVRAGAVLIAADGSLRHAESYGYSPEEHARFVEAVPGHATLAARAIRTRRPARLDLAAEDHGRSFRALREQFSSFASEVVSVPLMAHGVPLGALSLVIGKDGRVDPDLEAFLRAASDIGGQAVERARLRAGEERLQRTLEAVVAQMPVGVVVADPSGDVLVENAMAQHLLAGVLPADEPRGGVRERSAGGKDGEITESASPDAPGTRPRRRPIPSLALARCLEFGETIVGDEVTVRGPDGGPLTLLISAAPVLDPSGRTLGAVEVLSDISARREHELARETFIGVLSHELRTPITTIFGNATLLVDRPGLTATTRKELTEGIAVEATRLHEMVEDLLVLARVERGMDLAAAEPVLLTHFVREIVLAEQRNRPEIEYTLEIPVDVPLIAGDDGYVDQILRNLLSNAAKYGRGHVSVRLREVKDGVALSVSDDGPGIPADEIDKIFDLFFRSKRSLAARAPGAGIGLYVCRKLAAAMGARIDVSSAPTGTTFTVTFRRLEAE